MEKPSFVGVVMPQREESVSTLPLQNMLSETSFKLSKPHNNIEDSGKKLKLNMAQIIEH